MTPIIITLAGVFFTLLLLAEWRNKRSKGIELQHRSLQTLSNLQNLIALLQKHRGISAAFLRGQSKALPPLDDLRIQINAKIALLNIQTEIKNLDRWLAFTDHWQRFRLSSYHMPVVNSFKQHTNIISNLLLLSEEIVEIDKINYKIFRKNPNISMLCREYPLLIEYMGQVRAIGVGVLIDGACFNVEKLKLSTLLTEIPRLSKIVFLHLRENGSQTRTQHSLLQQAVESCAHLTHTAQHRLIDAKPIDLDIENFYAQASQAMENSTRLLSYEIEQISQALKSG